MQTQFTNPNHRIVLSPSFPWKAFERYREERPNNTTIVQSGRNAFVVLSEGKELLRKLEGSKIQASPTLATKGDMLKITFKPSCKDPEYYFRQHILPEIKTPHVFMDHSGNVFDPETKKLL